MASEGILVNGMTEILKKLLPVISQQIDQAWGVKDDLKKLGNTLDLIQALISDAEEKQINDATVKLWLRRLKDVVYDAEDLMDEICYEFMSRCERGSQIKHRVRDFISKSSNPIVFRFKMAGKIRAMNKSLDEIYNDQVRYTLNSTCGTSQESQADQLREKRNQLTTSVSDASALIGREDATSDIVKLLTNKSLPSVSPSSSFTSPQNSSLQEQLSVVSIVGMGGLGKTSLAQLVYQHQSIETHFEKLMWVCVSDKFDVYKILKEIIESITGDSCGDPSNVDLLARQVKRQLIGKKYMLVLDDLWNEDAGDWEKLKGFLVHGVVGSKLLVTTRSQKVASVVGGAVHHLQKLTDDDCWSIMQKKISFPGDEAHYQNMSNIGRDIARKCDGLPLAANFLGSLLYLNREESYWISINNDKNLWVQSGNKRVVSILKLSYDNLPSPLKQCFSFCCLFPKDWEIKRDILIRMWMAEGFLQPDEVNNKSLEDVGNDYFEFLLWNSFFQDVMKDATGDICTCKMHDLVHDLSMSVVDGKEFGIDGKEDVSQVRRLQLICDSVSSTITAKKLSKAKNLRTIVVLYPENYSEIYDLSSSKHLRILHPLGVWNRKVSFSISKFKHLRFLNLSCCEFDLTRDVSCNHSHNLQTLVLESCRNVSGFLHQIGPLKKLRYLDVSHSDIKVLPDDSIIYFTNLHTLKLHWCGHFEALPDNIGMLKHLSYLSLSGSSIAKIPDSITRLSNLIKVSFGMCRNLDALPTELGALTRLRCLDLSDTQIKVLPESCINNLHNLEIVNFGSNCELPRDIKNWPKLRKFEHSRYGDRMPRGMENLTSLETLDSYIVGKEFVLRRGHSGIGELAAINSLQVLHITSLENVIGGIKEAEKAKLKDNTNLRELHLHYSANRVDEDDDMVLEGLQPHSNLRELEIREFLGLNLPKWIGSSSNCLLPNLVTLYLYNCSCCEKLPALGMLPCLKDLWISKMKSVKWLDTEFYHQQQRKEEDSNTQNSSTTTSALFPSLVNLDFFGMENLEEWVSPPPSFDFYVHSFPLLEKLQMRGCPKLRSTPNSFPSLKELNLGRTTGKAVNSILSASRGEGCLTSLTSINISETPGFIYFPLAELLQNNTPNLHSLRITDCSDFRGFLDDGDASNNNNSLKTLQLCECPVLTCLPDLRLWTSLRELSIWKCDKLKEAIPSDYKTAFSFLRSLKVDFLQREDHQLEDPAGNLFRLINLMDK
ncbi:putative disease resistance protein RGA4 [Papaver somniferum]|uniref:putative disease resistance protein RGA4 n=1 Tax=Papaver somniferum TaxID=3469 RepID=UPI000E7009BC|nr:putative disease resistance protein RGA4 [Papaver somniferum]